MTGKDLIQLILKKGVDREVLLQKGSALIEIKPEDIYLNDNLKIVIK